MAQSQEQLAAAKELAKEYGLTASDFYQHKQSKAWLISRTGIEKVQYKAGILVRFQAERIELDFAAVKASATRVEKDNNTKLTIETFGSACKANCQVTYYLEMAEKRALSRAVLKLTDFYQLGVYGEDEMPPAVSDDMKGEAAAPVVSAPAPVNPEVPIMRAVPTAELAAPVQYATASQKEQILVLIQSEVITLAERNKMRAGINNLDEARAAASIDKLTQTISDRQAILAEGS